MRKALRTTAAVLALPVLINAVALSDMTPRAQNLPPACNNLYTAQIAGCTSQDWQSQQCSPSCSHAMQALVAPIQKACGGQGIQGQNLIVAYLAGVGPQQLCHNLDSQTTSQQTTAAPTTQKTTPSPEPTILSSSTSTAKSATKTDSLVVDSSSSASETSTRRTTAKQTKPTAEASSSAVVSSSEAAATSTRTNTAVTSSTQTTSAEGNSQTNFDDGSGGGSPFDTPGNLMNAAPGLSVSVVSFVMPAAAAALFAAIR